MALRFVSVGRKGIIMKKLSKKHLVVAFCVLALLAFGIVYFMPLSLSGFIGDDSTLVFSKLHIDIKDGAPYHESSDYNDITQEQKKLILDLLDDFTYRKNFSTLFSDGALSNNEGDGYFFMFVYEGEEPALTVTIAHDDEISVGDKNYTMNNSDVFIARMLEIIGE